MYFTNFIFYVRIVHLKKICSKQCTT